MFIRDGSNSYAATAIVGEVSGTSISFGAKNAFATTPQLGIKKHMTPLVVKLLLLSGDKKLYVGTVVVGTTQSLLVL